MAKKPKTRAQKAAAKRHARFKKTRVQTFGGTKKSYTARELKKIDDAGFKRSTYTGGAVADKKPASEPKLQPRTFREDPKEQAALNRSLPDATNPRAIENRLRQIRNSIASFTPISPVRLLNNREIAQGREDNARFRAANLTRPSRGGNSSTRIAAQATMQQLQPTTGQTGYSPVMGQTGLDNSQLTRIQNQAYDAAFGSYTTGAGGSTMSSVNTGTNTSAPSSTTGTSRGRFDLRMFAPLTTRNSGPRNLLNRRGMRITSLNI